MPSGAELATAWIRLVPTMEGVNGEIAKALGPAEDEADKSGKRAGSQFSKSMKVAAVAGAAVIMAGIAKVFQVGFEELKFGEKLNAQTDQLVANTGFAMSTSKINDYTLALSKISGISEEELQGAGNNIIKFGDVSEKNYKRAVDTLNDMGSAGKDVAGTSEALGKALADPAMAAGLLKRQGVILNEEQQKLIDTFVTAGDKAGAQGVILDALNDTYDGMSEKTGATLEGNLNKLNNSFENISGELVASLMPAITGLLSALQPVAEWMSNNPAAVTAVAIALGVLAVIIGVVAAATWIMNTALLANPITWIILGIIALIAALVLLVMNWDTVVKFLGNVWNSFCNWFMSALTDLGNFWNTVWTAVGDFVTTVWTGFTGWLRNVWQGFTSWVTAQTASFASGWNAMWAAIGAWIKSTWDGFVNGIKNIWTGFTGWIAGATNSFVSWWNGVWSGFGNFISQVWTNLSNAVRSIAISMLQTIIAVVSGFVSWWNGVWSGVGDVIRGVFSGIAGFIGGVWDGIVSRIRGAVGAILGIINGMIGGINKLLGVVNGLTGMSLNIPKIPGLAHGGTVTGSGTVLVGERGPELLTLPRGATVDPDIKHGSEKGGVIFNNYAPLGQSPAQALSAFATRAEVFQ